MRMQGTDIQLAPSKKKENRKMKYCFALNRVGWREGENLNSLVSGSFIICEDEWILEYFPRTSLAVVKTVLPVHGAWV